MARRRGAKQAEQAAEAAEEKAAKAAWALEEAHDQQRARDEKLRASQATVEAMRLNRHAPGPAPLGPKLRDRKAQLADLHGPDPSSAARVV